MQVQERVVLAHGLAIGPSELRPELPYALVQLLDLGFSKNGARGLMLQPFHESGEEVNVLSLGRCKFIVWLLKKSGRDSVGICLFQGCGMLLLLFLHVAKRSLDRSLQVRIILFTFSRLRKWLGGL